jgi:hypothetical protein
VVVDRYSAAEYSAVEYSAAEYSAVEEVLANRGPLD